MKKHNLAFLITLLSLIVAFAGCILIFGTDLTKSKFTIKFNANGGVCETESVVVKRGKTVSFPEISREHYTLTGWYNKNKLWKQNKKVYHNYTLTAHWDAISYDITFVGTSGEENTQSIKYDAVLPTEEEIPGYEFGWYTESEGNGTRVTTVGEALENEGKIYGAYKLITYTITLDLQGGEIVGGTQLEYTILTETFTLNTPTRGTTLFLGWTGEGITEPTATITIEQGSTGNRTYTANWDKALVYFVVDDKSLSESTIEVTKGDSINEPEIDSSLYGLTYYKVDKWFINSGCTIEATFPFVVNSNTTLYGSWAYGVSENTAEAFAKFATATTSESHPITIDSYDELALFVEYIQVHYVTQKLTFRYSGEITNETLSSLLADSTYPSMSTKLGYQQKGSVKSLYLRENNMAEEATLDVDGAESEKYTQKANGICVVSSGRAEDFDDFKINNVTTTLSVSSSNSLVYALEKGFRPVCAEGSAAESIYNSAKTVLRQICDDSMTDVQKAQAIYEWIIINTCYDHAAADASDSAESPVHNNEYKYASWYAEGVFDNGLAVCDGICKAFVILAKIEGIPCVRVTGNNHAWNKIYLNGAWYEIDATHGDQPITPSTEVVSYKYFLFTSTYRNAYQTSDYTELVCNTTYNFFNNADYETFDLLVDSKAELTLILAYAATLQGTNHIYTVCVALNTSTSIFAGKSVSESLGKDQYNHDIYIIFIG